MLGENELRAVKVFEKATADFVARYGGVPHCPECGMEAVPNPFPWLVGAHTWSCAKEDLRQAHGDFQSWSSRVPPRSWVPTEKHPAYIHEAFRHRSKVSEAAMSITAFVGMENLPRNANLEKMEIPGEMLRALWHALGSPDVSKTTGA